MRNFIIRTHVPYIGGDYDFASVSLDGKELVRYGDAYHEKGLEKCEGFVRGFMVAARIDKNDVTITFEEFHDPECYEYEPEDD